MSFLDRFSSKVDKEINELTFPDEFKRYLYYVEYNLEGFDFKNDIVNKAMNILKREYEYYQNQKDSYDFKTATNKYSHEVYLKDLMNNRDHYNRTEALAYLLIYDIIFYYKYSFYGMAFTIFKDHVVNVVKNLDRKTIPESFFCHHKADELFEKEAKREQNYLDLYQRYLELLNKLEKYESDE